MPQIITRRLPNTIARFLLWGLAPTGPIEMHPLVLCDATANSLMPQRMAASLMPVRTAEHFCPDEDGA